MSPVDGLTGPTTRALADDVARALSSRGRRCRRVTVDARSLLHPTGPGAARLLHRAGPGDDLVLVDGCFLQHPEFLGAWELVVFLREGAGSSAGARYLTQVDPERTADIVVDLHDPAWPVIRRMDPVVADRLGPAVQLAETRALALTACTPPAKGSPLFELGADEMEMGVGIHGEPGRRREKLTNADAIIDELLEACVTDLPYQQDDEVALMINGLGGTPISELYILYGRAHQQLADRGISVRKNYVGEYCTSLDMAGASLTLVKLDDELVRLLEAPAEVAVRIF